jgi:ABC-type Mn2+/Zn2+ transport system permease subunit
VPSPADLVALPFMRTALLELLLLGVSGGVLGTWIVLRRLAFFTHAVGGAVFPALVAAGPLGIGAQVAGIAAGLGYAAGVGGASRTRHDLGAATGLVLVAALSVGIVLASDIVAAPAAVDQLLFGTLLGLDATDLALSGTVAALALGGTALLGPAWLATGFDPEAARSLAVPAARTDAALLALVAVAAVAAIPAVGALLVTSIFIVPAATARLVTARLVRLLVASVCIAVTQGTAGLYMALALDVPAGPAVAVVGAILFSTVGVTQRARSRARGVPYISPAGGRP